MILEFTVFDGDTEFSAEKLNVLPSQTFSIKYDPTFRDYDFEDHLWQTFGIRADGSVSVMTIHYTNGQLGLQEVSLVGYQVIKIPNPTIKKPTGWLSWFYTKPAKLVWEETLILNVVDSTERIKIVQIYEVK